MQRVYFVLMVCCSPRPDTLDRADGNTLHSVLQSSDVPSVMANDVPQDVGVGHTICKTDNPCMIAYYHPYEGDCVFEIVDQIADVPCDDENPCTANDICHGSLCAGEIDVACWKQRWGQHEHE